MRTVFEMRQRYRQRPEGQFIYWHLFIKGNYPVIKKTIKTTLRN
ncbi:hypothetical protein CSC18_4310 [Klebsiella aerogenes]|nr:hypothetical protein CSC18_4310 [Klebsiella aerogenes]